ncbi:YlxM family DNA-binding protein [Syntrophomonas wolfei]|uniref:YlxM family DNA-binding protein n=1 Tax=Syntrophomonas wolfei TaxID=863 RepID=UPI000772F9E3|nr:YlxM family DNA-binding protein [Syntrophomonas wolfei]
MLEKTEHMIMLKDFYGPLLTLTQQDLMSLYYEDDWSLSEIAENRGTSRQAVYDVLKRAETALQEYEERLGLVDKFVLTRRGLEEAYALLKKTGCLGQKEIEKAIEILHEIMESV